MLQSTGMNGPMVSSVSVIHLSGGIMAAHQSPVHPLTRPIRSGILLLAQPLPHQKAI